MALRERTICFDPELAPKLASIIGTSVDMILSLPRPRLGGRIPTFLQPYEVDIPLREQGGNCVPLRQGLERQCVVSGHAELPGHDWRHLLGFATQVRLDMTASVKVRPRAQRRMTAGLSLNRSHGACLINRRYGMGRHNGIVMQPTPLERSAEHNIDDVVLQDWVAAFALHSSFGSNIHKFVERVACVAGNVVPVEPWYSACCKVRKQR